MKLVAFNVQSKQRPAISLFVETLGNQTPAAQFNLSSERLCWPITVNNDSKDNSKY